jgi:hypothetical protein
LAARVYPIVTAVIGLDFGACCALLRCNIPLVVLVSAPFPIRRWGHPDRPPSKHYQWYYSTLEANTE